MKTLHFETTINASPDKVWDTMLQDATYRQWTEAFSPGSYYEGGWNTGDKIVFLGPAQEPGKESGMLARIKESRPHEYVSIEHIGIIENGEEDTTSEKVKAWTPAYENYTLEKTDGGTRLKIDMDSDEKYVEMFEGMWPKALQKLKELCEQGN